MPNSWDASEHAQLHVLWQSFSTRQARCLSTMSTMPRVTTPRRLRSDAHRRSLPQKAGVSPTAIKKLRVDRLRGYLASYQLPTTGAKQQLV